MNQTRKSYAIYPWLVISLCSAFLFYKYILQVSPSIMTQELMQLYQANGTQLGNLAACFFYSYIVTQLFVGPLLDRFSPRLLTSLAIVLSAIGITLFAKASTLESALFSRALMGVGVAFATISYMKLSTVWFRPQRFAFLNGLLLSACMLGALFGQAPLALLVDHVGLTDSLYICAGLGFLIAGLFYLIVRDKNRHHSFASPSITQKISFNDIVQVVRNKRNWVLMIYCGLAFSPVAVFGGLWGNPFLQETYHLTRTQAAGLVSLTFIGTAVGAPLFGWLSEYLRNRLGVMAVGTFLSLMASVIVFFINPDSLIFVGILLFLFGFGSSSYMIAYTYGRETNSMVLAATVMSMINTGDGTLGAITEPLIGRLLDHFWDGHIVNNVHHFNIQAYHLSFSILPIYQIVALILVVFLYYMEKKRLGRGLE